ncbi:AAA family ATPase [Rhodococcus olei]|uniref:AAA family ATPase n=1 Tax=Rhodococcus olei TaxID=2161675 RepID=A0ABP8NV32_9NOCA
MLHVALLGERAIVDTETGDAASRSPRAVALLAYLVAHAGVPQSRQRIAETFWPDSPDGQALTNLRRELHHLRRALHDAPSLVVTGTDLCWRDGDAVTVDVRTFDTEAAAARAAAERGDDAATDGHGAAALGSYRGAFLPGTDDDWAAAVRADLEQRCVEVCDLLVEVRRHTGPAAAAVEAARRRIALRPLEETGYRALMTAQAELGDRAGAVRTYHRCAALLERELGVEPDPETRRVFDRLLGDGGRRSPAVPATGPLVGRDAELGALDAAWRRAAAGHAALVVVRGEPGVGKTRLVADFAARVRARGALVAHSRCYAVAGAMPFGPVADWLRGPAFAERTATLDPRSRAEVGRLTGAGPGPDPGSGGDLGIADAWRRRRFVEGLAHAVLPRGRPTLLVVDDLQWCDPETLDFLGYLVTAHPDAPLLVAATTREEAAAVARHLPPSRVPVTVLPLAPLDEAATARLADSLAGRALTPGDHALIRAGTGGFPLYLVEAMRAGDRPAEGDPEGVPADRLRRTLDARLTSAGPDAAAIAALIAAAGRDVTLDLLVEAGDLDPTAVVRAVDTLWRQRILRETGRGYDFTHDLLRDAAYARVDPPHRWLLHRRLAQALQLVHADDLDPYRAQLAGQYVAGGRPDRAVPHFVRAAEIASATFGYDDAIRLHRDALAAVRAGLAGAEARRRELGVLEAAAAPLTAARGYASPDLQEVLERAVDLAQRLGRRESLVAGLVGLWASRFVQGRNLDAEAVSARALTLAGELADPDALGSAHFACGGTAVTLAKPADALRHFALADELTGGARTLWVGARYDVHARAWSAHALALQGRTEDACTAAASAIALARDLDRPYSLAVALAYGAITAQMCDDAPRLRDTATELRSLCDRYGFAYYREWGLVLDGWARSRLDPMTAGIDRLRATGAFARMPYWLSLLADVHVRAGRRGDAQAVLDAALAAARARAEWWWLPQVLRRRGEIGPDGDANASRTPRA